MATARSRRLRVAVGPVRCYTTDEVLELLKLPRATFEDAKRRGDLPFVVELLPRIGRRARYRADLLERYLAGEWGLPRAFTTHRKYKP